MPLAIAATAAAANSADITVPVGGSVLFSTIGTYGVNDTCAIKLKNSDATYSAIYTLSDGPAILGLNKSTLVINNTTANAFVVQASKPSSPNGSVGGVDYY